MTTPDDIQIGDVREPPRERRLRPDRNRQYAVAACGSVGPHDLPVFVELDALREMEAHAASNTRVELGGVLLGGQYEDDAGQPFVIVADSLRAEHHESTRSSFKFTHETWARITQQRAGFPGDLHMVGWYHTHPGWGVFLSEMDSFICENFFNKALDLALVLDPCRGSRGWFQWSGEPGRQLRRLEGFYVFASRHRQRELESLAAPAGGILPMAPESRPSGSVGPASSALVPVVSPPALWLICAVFGMLSAQFLVLLLLAWRVLAPPVPVADDQRQQAAARMSDVLDRLDRRLETEVRARELDAQMRTLDRVARELGKGSPEGLVRSLDQLQRENEALKQDAGVYRDLEAKTRRDQEGLTQDLQKARANESRLRDQVAGLNAKLADGAARDSEYRQQIAELRDQLAAAAGDESTSAATGVFAKPAVWWGSLGLAAVLAIAAAAAIRSARGRTRDSGKGRAADDAPAAADAS
jgi:proteasome lid subunit RPN8/RPN11